MNEARNINPIPLATALKEDYDGAVVKHSSRTPAEWADEFRRRLIDDVERGRINPDRWFMMSQVNGLASRYGLSDPDDIVLASIPVDTLLAWTQFNIPSDSANGPAKRIMAARLNPEKYGHLANAYKSKAMRKLI